MHACTHAQGVFKRLSQLGILKFLFRLLGITQVLKLLISLSRGGAPRGGGGAAQPRAPTFRAAPVPSAAWVPAPAPVAVDLGSVWGS